MSSLDANTGETVFGKKRLPKINNIIASPVAAAERIYFTGRNGTTVVLAHGDDFRVLATNDLGEAVDASPAIVDDELFMRGHRHLFCISESNE